jgi:DNA-binding CsgD family transcriptional regulator
MALASALRSLAAASIGDFEEARRSSRNALGLASLNDKCEAAHSVRYRKLARALAASTCILIGDGVRAQRATVRHLTNDEHGLLILLRIAKGEPNEQVPRRIRGYARVITAVREAIWQPHRRFALSEAEFAVLNLFAQGLSAPQIAQQTGRSVHTIRAHTRAIIEKFGVRGRSAAIAFAQKSGLLS